MNPEPNILFVEAKRPLLVSSALQLAVIWLVALTDIVSAGAAGLASPASETTNRASAGPDPEAQIEMLVSYAMPGEHHKLLNRLAGDWDTLTRYWPKPGAEPVEARGHSTRRWILEGRFLMEELDGGNLGLAFRAVGFYGFDAFAKKYTSAWMDTMNTAILTNLGTYDKASDSVNFAGQYKDPWTGTLKKERGVSRFIDRDKHVVQLYVTESDGHEHKMLEIAYQRRPAESE